eukprot:gene15025-21965_t
MEKYGDVRNPQEGSQRGQPPQNNLALLPANTHKSRWLKEEILT